MTNESLESGSVGPERGLAGTGAKWLPLAGVLSAALASSCCLGPAVLGSLGLGGLGVTWALDASRPFLVGTSVAILACGFYLLHRSRTREAACCERSGTGGKTSRKGSWILWVATGVSFALLLIPAATTRLSAPAGSPDAEAGQPSPGVVLSITGMTCPACAGHVQTALLDHPSVEEVRVSYESGRAWIRFREKQTDPGGLVEVIESKTPYKATIWKENQP